MPNIWTHLIFGQEVLQELQLIHILEQPKLRNTFNLGCQGPDILFYHNFWPWQRDKKMNKLGSAMHSTECGPMLLETVHTVQARELDDPVVVYVLGFLLHHVLDRNMHPYIFYRSGFKKWDHQHFEVAMDTLIVKHKLGLETWRTPVWKQINIGEHMPEGTLTMLNIAAQQLYPKLTEHIQESDWDKAYQDMIQAQKIFHDPSGIKRILTFQQIEPMVFKRKLTHHDFLNEARKEWNHPALENKTSTSSIWDMWDLALEDGLHVIQSALNFLQENTLHQEKDDQALQAAIGNLSYETGLACEDGLEIKYADPSFW
ncbi:MAG: zinc dependent phospholipase C family protein [Paenibacillaceae bacterium]